MLYIQIQTSIMSNKMCMVVELMRSACCHAIKSRSCLRKPTLLSMAPSCLSAVGLPMVHRRAYSLDPLSSGSGWTTLGSFSQQHSVERTSPSSALTHRNLSAVAVQVGRFLWLFSVLKYIFFSIICLVSLQLNWLNNNCFLF